MGNPFSKDGVITKIVEIIPGGGILTAPVHLAAGNMKHAVQAVVGGVASVATLPLGPVVSVATAAAVAGGSALLDNIGVDEKFNRVEVAEMKSSYIEQHDQGDHEGAGRAMLDGLVAAMLAAASTLSAESGGQRCLRSVHGTYLRAYESEWKADLAPSRQAWEQWYVEDWGGKVVFKAIHSPGRFLSANLDGSVTLVDRPQAWEQWAPFHNGDDSWSFLSCHGTWLSGNEDGSVGLVAECDEWEHFFLERW